MGRLSVALGSPTSVSTTSWPWPEISRPQPKQQHRLDGDDDNSMEFFNDSIPPYGGSGERTLRHTGRFNWDGIVGINEEDGESDAIDASDKNDNDDDEQQRNQDQQRFIMETSPPLAHVHQQQGPIAPHSPKVSMKNMLPPSQLSKTSYQYDHFPLHNSVVIANCPHAEWMAQATVSFYEVEERKVVQTVSYNTKPNPIQRARSNGKKSQDAAATSTGSKSTKKSKQRSRKSKGLSGEDVASSSSRSLSPSPSKSKTLTPRALPMEQPSTPSSTTTTNTTTQTTVVAQIVIQIRPVVHALQKKNSHTHIFRETTHHVMISRRASSTKTHSDSSSDIHNSNTKSNDDSDNQNGAAPPETEQQHLQPRWRPREAQIEFSIDRQRIALLLFHPHEPASKLVLFQLRRPRRQPMNPVQEVVPGSSRNLLASKASSPTPASNSSQRDLVSAVPMQPIPLPSYLQDLSDSSTYNNNLSASSHRRSSMTGTSSSGSNANSINQRKIMSPAVATHPQIIQPWGVLHMITAITSLRGTIIPEPTLLVVTQDRQWLWLGCRTAQVLARAKHEVMYSANLSLASAYTEEDNDNFNDDHDEIAELKSVDTMTDDGSLDVTLGSGFKRNKQQRGHDNASSVLISMSNAPPIVSLSATVLPNKSSATAAKAASSPKSSQLQQQGRVLAIDATGQGCILEWDIAPPTLAQTVKFGRRNSTGNNSTSMQNGLSSTPTPVSSPKQAQREKMMSPTTQPKNKSMSFSAEKRARNKDRSDGGKDAEPPRATSMPTLSDGAKSGANQEQAKPSRFQAFLSRFPARRKGQDGDGADSVASEKSSARKSKGAREKSPVPSGKKKAARGLSPKANGRGVSKSPTRTKSSGDSPGKKSKKPKSKGRHRRISMPATKGTAIRSTTITTNVDMYEVAFSPNADNGSAASRSLNLQEDDWRHVVGGSWLTPSLLAVLYKPGFVKTGPNQLPCVARVYALKLDDEGNPNIPDSHHMGRLHVDELRSLEWTQDDLEDLSIFPSNNTVETFDSVYQSSFDAHFEINYDSVSHCLVIRTAYCSTERPNIVPVRTIWNWRDNVLGLVVPGSFIRARMPFDDNMISPDVYMTSQWMLAWGGQKGRHLVLLDSMHTEAGVMWYQRIHEVGILSPQHSSVVSLDESISLLMGNSSLFFPMVSRPNCRRTAELQWRETALPLPYLQDNGPPRLVAMSMGRQADPDCRRGFSIAVACHRGVAMLTSTLTASYVPRWRLFGNEVEERSFRVVAMTWWECDPSSLVDYDEDLLVTIIQHCDSRQQFLACWSAKRLDLAHQLMQPFRRRSNASLSSATEALSWSNKWGIRLPDDFMATSVSVLAESAAVVTLESTPRRAVAMCSRSDLKSGGLQHVVFNLQVVETSSSLDQTKPESYVDQAPFAVVGKQVSKGIISPRHNPALHSMYGAFLASANFQFDLEWDAMQQRPQPSSAATKAGWLVTLGILYTPGGLKVAVLKQAGAVNLLPVVENREVAKYWLANVSNESFTWAIECTDGDLLCWSVPSRGINESSPCPPSELSKDLSKGLQAPKVLKQPLDDREADFAFLHGSIHNVGSSSDWMQHSSMGHKSEMTLGIAPGSSFGCLLRSGQSSKKLHRLVPDGGFDVDIFAADFLDYEIMGPSTFIMTPPACIPVLYSHFVEVAHLKVTYMHDRPKKGDAETSEDWQMKKEDAEIRIRTIEQRIVHRLNDAPNQDAISMALQLLILRAVEQMARAQKKRPTSRAKVETARHTRLLTKALFAEIVRLVEERMSGIQIASLFVEVARQMEPSFLSYLFPLPIASEKLGTNAIEGSKASIFVSNSITPQDLFDHTLHEKSLLIPAATLPLLSPRVQSRRYCEVLLKYCLDSIMENTNPLCDIGFDSTSEARVVIGDIFRFGIKLEDGADWDMLLGNSNEGSQSAEVEGPEVVDESHDINDLDEGDDGGDHSVKNGGGKADAGDAREVTSNRIVPSLHKRSMDKLPESDVPTRGALTASRSRSESSLSLGDLKQSNSMESGDNDDDDDDDDNSAPREGSSIVCFSRSQSYSQSPRMSTRGNASRTSVLNCLVPAMFSSSTHLDGVTISDDGSLSSAALSTDDDSAASLRGSDDDANNSAEKLEGVAVIVGDVLIEQDTSFPEYWRLVGMICRLLEVPDSARRASATVQWRELLDRIQLKDIYLLVGRQQDDVTRDATIEVLAGMMEAGQVNLDADEAMCILDIVSILLNRLQTNMKENVSLRSHLTVIALLVAQICGCYTELVLGEDAEDEEDLSLIEECIEKAVELVTGEGGSSDGGDDYDIEKSKMGNGAAKGNGVESGATTPTTATA
mmetsp:Transcript_4958/g.14430  ORF Transcript_4958/g.14430 Transcript_4958/m.14430 type:complete len:2326 (-) Transcript_4958:158-7135(-)|eukprot:CAMPEP_0119563874 /NCGR_PEP_ID=MMETSP1352-20130426/25080_1 /TAXON_ID=265584 /ORGANISM="Stauroneis constricta, Strain CCMP1120" /LENGTH=2325 /DNA_ID=CAMNT_0007612557 /DNA_START=244 /DNA_END=7221 /DNA_ORIENTATION=-